MLGLFANDCHLYGVEEGKVFLLALMTGGAMLLSRGDLRFTHLAFDWPGRDCDQFVIHTIMGASRAMPAV